MEIKIPTTDPEYTVDGQTIVELQIKEINFKQFCDIVEKSTTANDEKASQRKVFRARAKAQITCLLKVANGSGSTIPMTDALLNKMPLQYTMRMKDAVNEAMMSTEGADKPSVLNGGDGIATVIHMKLGTPIRFQGDKPPITELEFRAEVFEDLEDVILADSRVDQIVNMMKIAKPVDGPETITTLPSWAIDQLSFEDGMFIANSILPNFTQGQQDSQKPPTN